MKVSLVIFALGNGGAERILSTLANRWSRQGHQVDIILLGKNNQADYPLDPSVNVVALGLDSKSSGIAGAVSGNLRRTRALRQQLRILEPDVVVGFMDSTNVLTALASVGLCRTVLTEHTVPTVCMTRLWKILRLIAYPLADVVVVQTEEARKHYPRYLGRRVVVLPNPVKFPLTKDVGREKVVVSMGRLSPEKRFDVLIRVFSDVYSDFPDWRLIILGEGAERERLEELSVSLGVSDRVSLPGWQKSPADYLASSSIYAMTSEFEGFGNAMVEGMSMGLPVVAYDCPVGPRSILRDGEDGWLVANDDDVGMSMALRSLMIDENLRAKMGRSAQQVRDRFNEEVVMGRWDDLLRGNAYPMENM